jgi:tetratricopeptide (TPR) repeat protein
MLCCRTIRKPLLLMRAPSSPAAALSPARCIAPLLLVIAALLAPALRTTGQVVSSPGGADAAIHSHFAAAQTAQRDKDYPASEREYQAVLALAPDFAEVRMNLGLVYQLQNRLPEAMAQFRRALKIKPALTGANFFLGVDHCKLGEGARAIPYLQAAMQAEPRRSDIWLWLATAQEIAGDLPAEVLTLRRALDSQPANTDLLYLLGHSYERLGNSVVAHMDTTAHHSARNEQLLAESYAASNEWPSAVIHFQNALAVNPHQLGVHVALGEVLLRAGRVAEARPEFDAELQLDPRSLRSLVRRGEAALIQGNIDAALQDWAQSIAIDEPRAQRILGVRETRIGDSAIEQLPDATREAIQRLAGDLQSRNSPAARFALGFLATQSGNSSPQEFDAARTANPESPTAPQNAIADRCSAAGISRLLNDGRFSELAPCVQSFLGSQASADLRIQVASALLDAGEIAASFLILDALPPADRNSLEASYWRARCYERLATSAYLRLYQADPNSLRLHQLMGDLAAAKDDDAKAIEEYRAAIALNSSVPNLHYSLGHLLWKDMKVLDARVELSAELALSPHHAGALDDLGDTYLLEHQPTKALPYLLEALAANPANPDVHRDVGTAYAELHEYPKAAAQFKIALAGDHDGSVHYKLARVYQALGEKENAAREFALSSSLNRETHSKLEKQTERLAEITRPSQHP